MERTLATETAPYLARLQELPFIRVARLQSGARTATEGARLSLQLKSSSGLHTTHRHIFLTHRSRLERAIIVPLERIRDASGDAPLLMAPFVSPPMSEWLSEHQLEFVDLAGNCRLTVGQDHIALIQGRRPQTSAESRRAIGGAGYQVLFALMAGPATHDMPLRAIAQRAGVSKSVVAVALKRFEQSGLITSTRTGIQISKPQQAFHRWWMVQADQIAPRQLMGRFRTSALDPEVAEARLEHLLASEMAPGAISTATASRVMPRFAWGGLSAAWRRLRHYRGTHSVLHVLQPDPDLPKQLGLLPSATGNLTLYRHESSLPLEGAEAHLAHPMLVYADLCMSQDERALETAVMWGKEFLDGFV